LKLDWRSLQFRLAWQLTALFAVAALVVLASIAWQAWTAAQSLDERELDRRLDDIANSLVKSSEGKLVLHLSPKLEALFQSPDQRLIFALLDKSGTLFAASPDEFGALVATWPRATDESTFFRLTRFGAGSDQYDGLTRLVDAEGEQVTIAVAVVGGGNAFIHAVLKEFVLDIAWVIPAVLGLTLAVAVFALRQGLKPLRSLSTIAAGIGPIAPNLRLPEDGLPSELLPLVHAFNQALGRLDEGIGILKRFTANAAHELRTPLAVLTAEIDSLEHTERSSRLKGDVARMNRLVGQLLQVARLDHLALDVSGKVNLQTTAADMVSELAPRAIAEGKALALLDPKGETVVRGNADAIGDALRNLIENAIAHTAKGTEVEIGVSAPGCLQVADRSPGVSAESKSHIFERFWRGPGMKREGAGLGLAIVREIMDAHHGEVAVEDRPGGGAVFSLVFKPSG
jgi:two-component system, OmpR family, sensor histidine kinase TctE